MIKRDSKSKFRFASLQSPVAKMLLGEDVTLESMVLVEGSKIYRKSSAALRIAGRLDGAWPLLAAFLIVPRRLRDALYDWIGARRYRWFGKRETCWTPRGDLAERFLD